MDELDESQQRAALDRFLAANPELEQLSARLATFNIFHALRIEKAEIRHSNVLAWLLDPSESHGLRDVFLRRILSSILLESGTKISDISSADVELMNLMDVEVEVHRELRHTDLCVIVNSSPNILLLIENKIGSGEGPGQLSRYQKVIGKEYPNHVLVRVFLTLDGHATDDDDASEFIPFSYDNLLDTLTRIVEFRRPQLASPVAVFLEHYLDTLRRLTMRNEAVMQLCKKIYREHKDAIDLISEYGMTNEFRQVSNECLSQHNFHVLYSTNRQVWFVPKSWMQIVPANGTAWRHMDPPLSIVCWITQREADLRLLFEVSGMDDSKLRRRCVERLSAAGFKFGKAAFEMEAKYSRFLHLTIPLNDADDAEQLQSAFGELVEKAMPHFQKAETVLKDVFKVK
jgi:hypothetical protein